MKTTMYQVTTYPADKSDEFTHYVELDDDITEKELHAIFEEIALRDWGRGATREVITVDLDWVYDMGFDVE